MSNEIPIYEGKGQSINVWLDSHKEILWLMHLKSIYTEDELAEKALPYV